jgi:ABC-type sugar transport system substrate-binding protein
MMTPGAVNRAGAPGGRTDDPVSGPRPANLRGIASAHASVHALRRGSGVGYHCTLMTRRAARVLTVLLLLAALALSLLGCRRTAVGTPGRTFRVGYSAASWTLPWTAAYRRVFEREIAGHAAISISWHDAGFDVAAMAETLRAWTRARYDLILSWPLDPSALVEVYAQAAAAGIPVLLTMEEPDEAVLDAAAGFSGYDERDAGRAAAALLHSAFKGRARVAVVSAPRGSTAERHAAEGFAAEINRLGSATTVVASVDGQWDTEAAYRRTLELLRLQTAPQAIYVQDDGMGSGVIRALAERGFPPGRIALVGQGGSAEAMGRLRDGWYLGIVRQSPGDCAVQDAWFVHAFLEEHRRLPRVAEVTQRVVTPANADSYPPDW